jgi:hypothetical protein
MSTQLQLVATVISLTMLLIVLELVRRRRLFERYAILWLLSAIVLTAMAVWGRGLEVIARALGVASPPNALFAIALGFVILLLLHFSVAVSRLSDQSKVLAQRVALLEERLREAAARESEEAAPRPTPLVAERPEREPAGGSVPAHPAFGRRPPSA